MSASGFALSAGATLGANGVITFTTAAAMAFFSDDVLTFGTLAGNNTRGINLDLTAADAVGFQGNFLVGTAGPAVAVAAAAASPSPAHSLFSSPRCSAGSASSAIASNGRKEAREWPDLALRQSRQEQAVRLHGLFAFAAISGAHVRCRPREHARATTLPPAAAACHGERSRSN